MGQQPNLEISEAQRPSPTPETPPARSWRPTKPGVITRPEDVPQGGSFGQAGPDAGWALRLLAGAELPDEDPDLKAVLASLMTARAAASGRAPILEDLEVALVLCGYGFEAPDDVIERRERWKAAVPHETRPGHTAVAETDLELIVNKPEQVRWALSHSD